MKVAYNNCDGGFGLSPKGLTAYAKRKGISLTWYRDGKRVNNLSDKDGLSFSDSLSLIAYTKDLGEIKAKGGDSYYPDFKERETRSDPDLIAVIEELGEKAEGWGADLEIAEIPDSSKFEIDEYNGDEQVVPTRQSWN